MHVCGVFAERGCGTQSVVTQWKKDTTVVRERKRIDVLLIGRACTLDQIGKHTGKTFRF